MAQPIKKLAESTPGQQDLSPTEVQPPRKKPWARMEGESLLWFNRFVRYRKLGHKRSLQAAFEQERSQISALKSTKTNEKPAKLKKAGHLQEVSKSAQVPGSWKQASIKFSWVQRARAWDEHVIDNLVEGHLDDILQDAALGIERVKLLKELLHILRTQYNAAYKDMTYEQQLSYIRAIQSVLDDIRKEMGGYDEAVARILIRRMAADVYRNADLDELRTGKFKAKQN